MGVTAVVRRGKSYWRVQVIRGQTRIRRFLDRKTYLQRDALALERQLIDELETGEGEAQAERATHDRGSTNTTAGSRTSTITDRRPSPAMVSVLEDRRSTPGNCGSTEDLARFDVFAERYLALQDPSKSDHRNKVRNVRLHLIPAFGALPLRQINRRRIDELRISLRVQQGEPASSRRQKNRKEAPRSARRKGGRRSPKTINNILGTLRAVLNLACDYELLDRAPKIAFEKVPKKDPEFLDFAEAEALIAATDPKWRLMVWTAIRTGLRRGELFELRWKDLSLDTEQAGIRVRRSLRQEKDGSLTIKEPKGRRARTVPLTPSLANALREVARDAEELVFPAEGGDHRRFGDFYRAVKEAARTASLSKQAHPHMLRHTFASHCYMRRVPPQIVQKWLGHSSVSTTERYAHLRPNTDDELIAVLEGRDSSS